MRPQTAIAALLGLALGVGIFAIVGTLSRPAQPVYMNMYMKGQLHKQYPTSSMEACQDTIAAILREPAAVQDMIDLKITLECR